MEPDNYFRQMELFVSNLDRTYETWYKSKSLSCRAFCFRISGGQVRFGEISTLYLADLTEQLEMVRVL